MLEITGNVFLISYKGNELTDKVVTIQLPDGYSFETLLIISARNVSTFEPNLNTVTATEFTFPAVNSKSPCTLTLSIIDIAKPAEFRAIISQFGQIPDPHYFDNAFDPILVTGDDGNKYDVIPSDQFK